MLDKSCKIIIKKAANGFIAQVNDNGDPFVFSTEDQVVEWFRGVIASKPAEVAARKGGGY